MSLGTLKLLALGAAMWLAAAPGCEPETSRPAPRANYPAVINGEPITVDEFQVALNEIKEAGKGYFANKEAADRIKRDLLERLIEQRLLIQEARKRRIALDPNQVEATIQLIEKQYPSGELDKQLAGQNKDRARFEEETRQSLLIQRLLKQEVVDRIAISQEDIAKYYEEHRDRFVRPEEIRVRQIVSRTMEEAEELRKQIMRGSSFEELARQHSLGPEGKQGGDLGYFPRGRMPPEIEEVCFKLWAGSKASKVIESPYGFHLFKVIDKRPARELSLEAARPEIEKALLDERTQEAERFFIRTLREQARIERDLPQLERIH